MPRPYLLTQLLIPALEQSEKWREGTGVGHLSSCTTRQRRVSD